MKLNHWRLLYGQYAIEKLSQLDKDHLIELLLEKYTIKDWKAIEKESSK
jgi:hypothetical protein